MRKTTSVFILLFALVLLCLGFAAAPARATADLDATTVVTVRNFSYSPRTVNIRTGGTVQWDNVQGAHNVVADDGSFNSGSAASAPWSFSHTFTAPGVYPYYCSPHGGPGGVGMSGVVVVSTIYEAVLRGANEVPPVSSSAIGGVRVTDSGGPSLTLTLGVRDIVQATAAHIHCGTAGSNGPVGVTIAMGGPFSGSGNLTRPIAAPDAGNSCGWSSIADVVAAMNSGGAYVNVHTTANPGGELRGQLQVVP